jgi:hypothetical protein
MSNKRAPVHPHKIALLVEMMNTPHVREAWDHMVRLPEIRESSRRQDVVNKQRAWDEYCYQRDKFLGLPARKPEVINYEDGE